MRKHWRLILLILVAAAAAALPFLLHAKHRWDNPRTVTQNLSFSYQYGLDPLTTQVTCEVPEYAIRGRSYTVTCRISTSEPAPEEAILGGEVQHPPAVAQDGLGRPHPTAADDAQLLRYIAEAQNSSLRPEAIDGLSNLAQKFLYDDHYQIAFAKALLNDPSTTIKGLEILESYLDDPEAATADHEVLAHSQLWLAATHASDPYGATAGPLDFAPGRPLEPIGNAAGLAPPQSASFTLQTPKSDRIVLYFTAGLTRTVAGSQINQSLRSANLSIPVKSTWINTLCSVTLIAILVLAALAITLLLFAGIIFAAGKLFPVLALDRWKQSRIADVFRWIRRHWVMVLYVALAVIYLAPNPLHQFQTNRQAFHRLVDLFIGNPSNADNYYLDPSSAWIGWSVLFLAPLLGGLARLLPIRRRLPTFLLNVLVPALAVAFCLGDLFLFFAGFLVTYFAVASRAISDNTPYVIALIVAAALALPGKAGAAFQRLSPRRSLYYAGLAITLAAITELLLFSAAYYAGHVSFDLFPFGSISAFDRLPIYIWIGIGFLIQSDLFSAPEKTRRRPSTSHAADSAQTFALTAIALCAFGVTQIPHSMDNLNRLKALRRAFAFDTLVDRTLRQRVAPAGDVHKSSYRRPGPVPFPPFVEFNASGMDASIEIMQKAAGHDGLVNFSVTENNGPNQTSHWEEDLNPVFPSSTAQPGDALQKLLGSTDKDIHKEDVYERLYHEDELKITSETTSIPGTPVQISSQYISWCLVLLNIVILCLIEDRLKLAEAKPEDACDCYLLWGNTFITRTLAVVWPFWLAFAMLLQVAGVAAITLYQGVALGWLLLPLLILAACVAPVAFSIAMSCYRIRRAIRNSLAAAATPPNPPAPATP